MVKEGEGGEGSEEGEGGCGVELASCRCEQNAGVLHCVQDDGEVRDQTRLGGLGERRGGGAGFGGLGEAGGDSLLEASGWLGGAEGVEDLVDAGVGL